MTFSEAAESEGEMTVEISSFSGGTLSPEMALREAARGARLRAERLDALADVAKRLAAERAGTEQSAAERALWDIAYGHKL